jgi:hypothetical protein
LVAAYHAASEIARERPNAPATRLRDENSEWTGTPQGSHGALPRDKFDFDFTATVAKQPIIFAFANVHNG